MAYITLGADHAGYNLKEYLKKELSLLGYTIHDVGTFSDKSTDYNDYVSKAVSDILDKSQCAILICSTGVGVSMAANRINHIRCALCFNPMMASLARLHNDANILALGSSVVNEGEALEIAKEFLTTPFSGEERYVRRNNKLDQ